MTWVSCNIQLPFNFNSNHIKLIFVRENVFFLELKKYHSPTYNVPTYYKYYKLKQKDRKFSKTEEKKDCGKEFEFRLLEGETREDLKISTQGKSCFLTLATAHLRMRENDL